MPRVSTKTPKSAERMICVRDAQAALMSRGDAKFRSEIASLSAIRSA